MSKSAAPRRRRHTNSKLGCANCKRKKIRCDENLPECKNCTKGKKESCSYLTLNKSEINRIRLTHSLRSEQNKLLNQDYRLPTSKSGFSLNNESSLEIKMELSKLPIRIPTVTYPPLQYRLLTIYDFENEFKVIEDESDSPEPESTITVPKFDFKDTGKINKKSIIGTELPNSINYSTKFKVIPHKLKVQTKIKSNEYKFTKGTSLEYLIPLLHRRIPGIEIFEDLCICMGQMIILHEFKRCNKVETVRNFKSKSFELHNKCLTDLKIKINEFNEFSKRPITPSNDEYMNKMTPVLYYSNNLLSYCLILLDFSMENYNKINSSSIKILQNFIKYNNSRPVKSSTINSLISLNQYNILSLNVPTYNPSYIYEIFHNLMKLSNIFSQVKPEIFHLFNGLVSFIQNEIFPLIKNNMGQVLSFPINQGFNLLKNWLRLFPSQFFIPGKSANQVDDDLLATLRCYYYVIGASLRSTFPYHLYFFGINFTTLENSFDMDYFKPKINEQINDFLTRHNYYGLRVYSFLRHRHLIFIKYIQWKSNVFPSDPFAPRTFKNIIEVPIKGFNHTLIRPEHYPSTKELDKSLGHEFHRKDETLLLKLYTRNVETLDFFNKEYILQFDNQSLRLLRDYRPPEDDCVTKFVPLNYDELEFYWQDRMLLLKKFTV
ncbi:hypothetical protein CLIB1444_13S03730 [[Candida] jaroonii]|uniref:Uncharacterized protein n=1 Tax=[Candida] jaroonii TaxID=467808 RepID=A0ACA9YEC2_9ASCO|nr:hypothetical protein CLIB1444_13S03730 [[Candida] jaroonii]